MSLKPSRFTVFVMFVRFRQKKIGKNIFLIGFEKLACPTDADSNLANFAEISKFWWKFLIFFLYSAHNQVVLPAYQISSKLK